MKDALKEFKDKSVSELKEMLIEARESLRDLKFKDANKQLRDVRQIRVIKKKISRILTVINNKKDEQTK